jgi:hypothetical protein
MIPGTLSTGLTHELPMTPTPPVTPSTPTAPVQLQTVVPEFTLADGKTVAIPSMKSLYIEMYFGKTRLSSGTAFLVARDKTSRCVLITNRHNVTGRRQDTGKCLSKHAAIPDNIVIYFHKEGEHIGEWLPVKLPLYRPDGDPYWFEHPTLGATADVVALNLNWGRDVRKVPYYLDGSNSTLDRGILVDPGEPISVIGFPFGLSSFGKFPIWATGFLAQDLDLVVPEKPVLLIDCRTREGQSGSPVIAYRVGGSRELVNGIVYQTMSPNARWEFLGIYCGRVNGESDLGIVWHASAVEAVYTAAEADFKRRESQG